MFVFLYGPDDYRRVQKKKWFVSEFKKKHSDLGLAFFDLEAEGAVDALNQFAKNQSIFDTAKLAVLENAFELESDKLAKILKPFVETKSTTILIAERDKPVKALAFLIEKPSLSQKFEHLEGIEWIAFIKEESKKRGAELAPDAAQFLATVYQNGSWALVTELEKLSALTARGSHVISKKDLDAFDLEAAPNYWALLSGMKSADARTRLYALEKLFSMNDPAPKLFNILAAQAGPKVGRMAEYDVAVKSGKMEYEEVLISMALDG